MIFEQTWNRFRTDWKSFGLMGAGPILLWVGAGLLMVVIAVATLGGSVLSMVMAGMEGFEPTDGDLLDFFGRFLVFFIIAMVVGLTVGPMSYAGLMGSVVAYRRGEPVSLGAFWTYATRYWLRILGLLIISGLAVMMVQAFLVWIPVLGQLVAMVLSMMISLYLSLYPAYLVVAEDAPVLDAVGQLIRYLGRSVKEALLASLVYLLFVFVMLLSGVVNLIPLLGQLAWLAGLVFFGPLVVYYYIDRFETNVRPLLKE